jgi:peptidoglycan hydrolase-like protein with peptidoglycan-binding domain
MSIRLNLVSTIQRLVGRPAPLARPEAKPASGPVMAADTLNVTPVLRSSRFADTPELDAVLKGGQLAKGAKGDAVARVQQALQDMAFVLPAGVDGGFGNQTAQALKNFQSAAKLPQTGVLDRDTLVALDKYAPPAGKTSWEAGADRSLVPSPDLGKGKKARVVVDISQHRLFLYDKHGELEKIYGVRSGNSAKGWGTQAGLKVIDGKNNDPRSVAQSLWGGTGTAFGTRLLNLSDYNLETGKKFLGKHKGQELHGTFDNDSIGRDFSHGCVGLKNADIEEIFDKLGNGEFVRFDQ